MSTVEERLSALEAAMTDVRLQLVTQSRHRAWLDDVAGSHQQWREFEEVLQLGREFRASVADPADAESGGT